MQYVLETFPHSACTVVMYKGSRVTHEVMLPLGGADIYNHLRQNSWTPSLSMYGEAVVAAAITAVGGVLSVGRLRRSLAVHRREWQKRARYEVLEAGYE